MSALSLPGCSERAPDTSAAAPAAAATAQTKAADPAAHLHFIITAPQVAGQCAAVSIRVEPLTLEPGTGQGAAAATSVSFTDLRLAPTGAADARAACSGEAYSAALARGNWRVSVPLPSGLATCERTVGASASDSPGATLTFADGKAGCQ